MIPTVSAVTETVVMVTKSLVTGVTTSLVTEKIRETSTTESYKDDPLIVLKSDLANMTKGYLDPSEEISGLTNYNISALMDDLSDLREKQNVTITGIINGFTNNKLWQALFQTQEGIIFMIISGIIGIGTVHKRKKIFPNFFC